MHRSQTLSPSLLDALAAALAAARDKARAWLEAYAQARARAVVARELHRMSDHLLRDIGLHRSQIETAVRGERPWT
jgi:uncharacterized protein YjiS (DUF1127 family)